MCGRYALAVPPELAEIFRELLGLHGALELEARYNIAPTQDAPIVRARGDRHNRDLDLARWGLVPHWSKDTKIGARTINARSETAATKPAFRDPFRLRRCLVPASGFYEWKSVPGQRQKQPYYIHATGGGLLAFAGLWDRWRGPGGEHVVSFTILTTEPNELVRPLHDRMPVILPAEHFERWLDPELRDVEALEPLLVPASGEVLELRPVSPRVNKPEHDDPACIAAVPTLF